MPQEYDLPLADGITGTATYCKTQEGVVLVSGWVKGAATPDDGSPTILAVLPEGYRPQSVNRAILPCSGKAPNVGAVRMEIVETGEVKCLAWNWIGNLNNGVSVDMVFLAG